MRPAFRVLVLAAVGAVAFSAITWPGALAASDLGKSSPGKHVFETPTDIGSRLPTRLEGLFAASPVDTYVVAEFSFENEFFECDREGWISVDITTQLDTFFHIDDFAGLNGGDFGRLTPLEGEKSLWCGARSSAEWPYCGWAALPGYGDSWEQFFESVEFPVVGDVVVSYKVRWDSEAGYDATYLEYWDTSGDDWHQLPVNNGASFYDGIGEMIESVVVNSADIGDTLNLRFRFASDHGWSDQDGLWDTDGAVIIDSLTLVDATGVIDYQDFENEAVGALSTSDGDWSATVPAGFGDYSSLFQGANVLQEDPCVFNISCLWGFFNGSPTTYACGGHPEQTAIPYYPWWSTDLFLKNEVWSPPIEWSTDINGNPIPSSATGAHLEFDVYRDLEFDALIFYGWHIRSIVDGCAGNWEDYNFVYYGGQKDWLRVVFDVGVLVQPNASHVQIALGCYDMCDFWCFFGREGGCPSHAPLIDNVRLVRLGSSGPLWQVRHIDLFNDNFPEDGDITCQSYARADMAIDMLPTANPAIIPGDSAVVEVDDPSFVYTPLNPPAEDPDPSIPPQVYCWVRVGSHLCTPGHTVTSIQSPDNVRYPGDPMTGTLRYPFTGQTQTCGPWTYWQYQMDFVYSAGGGLIADRYCIDLMDVANGLHTLEDQAGNTGVFVPGDTIYYFFEAVPNSGLPTYWHRKRAFRLGQGAKHQTLSWDEACHEPCEFMILPDSGREVEGDILLVDDCDDRGGPAEIYFDLSFEDLGLMNLTGERRKGPFYAAFTSNVDIFDVIGPSSVVGNSLASRVQNFQLQLIGDPEITYQKILWNTGSLSRGLVGDGSPPNGGSGYEKSDDWMLLNDFMNLHPNNPGVAFWGDDLAEEWSTLNGADAVAFRGSWMNYQLLSGNHVGWGLNPSEKVRGDLPESMYGCPVDPIFDNECATTPYSDYWVAFGGCPAINDFDVIAPSGPPCSEQAEYVGDGSGAVLAQATPNAMTTTARSVLSGFGYNYIRNEQPAQDNPGHTWMDRTEVLRDILMWFENPFNEPISVDPPAYANRLYEAYPNPFNPMTTIKYEIKEQAQVTLKIYNVAGKLVKTLVNEEQSPRAKGFAVEWDGTNNAGERVSSGVYFYRLATKDFSKTKKMVLLK